MIDGNRSTFPDNVDTFKEMSELSPALQEDVTRYRGLKQKGDSRTEEEDTEYRELTNKLVPYICSAEDWNLLCDSMYKLEQHYIDKNFDKFVEDMKAEIESSVQGKVNVEVEKAVNTTVKNYVENRVPFSVIISETEPSYIEGALWIKPKPTE